MTPAFRWVPLVLPLVCLAVLLPLQPPDHLGAPDGAAWLHPAVYDDNDLTALALRALNAGQGRRPGRLDEPAGVSEETFAARLRDPDWPLAPRYWLEYPQGALPIFRLGFLWQGGAPPPPAALLDAWHPNVVRHRPRADERPLYRRLRRAGRTYSCLMAGCLLALVLVLRRGYGAGGPLPSAGLLLMLPAALYFTLYRFDIVPALLTALSLACLGRRWWSASALLLAAATMVKVYPVLLVPLVLRYLGGWRRAGRWLAVYAAAVVAFVLPPLLGEGLEAVLGPYRVQLSRQREGYTLYGLLLPAALGENDALGKGFRLAALLLVLAGLLRRRPGDLAGLLRNGAVLLVVFVSLSVFYSPQWLLWLAPLLLPLTGRTRGLAWLVAALDLVTFCTFPLVAPEGLAAALAAARFLVLGGIVLVLGLAGWREGVPGAGARAA